MSLRDDSGEPGFCLLSREGADAGDARLVTTSAAQAPSPPPLPVASSLAGERGSPKAIPLVLEVQPSLVERRLALALKRRLTEEAKAQRAAAREAKREKAREEERAFEAKEGAVRAMQARLTRHYFLCFEQARGVPPIFDGGDGKALRRAIERSMRNEAKVEGMITVAYSDPFLAKTATIKSIAANPSKYLHASPAASTRQRAPATGTAWRKASEVEL